jgi:hypothetical protein
MTPVKTVDTPSPTGLYWSERGHVGCARHTPFEGTDTWIWERWEPVPVEVLGLERQLSCETCGVEPVRGDVR